MEAKGQKLKGICRIDLNAPNVHVKVARRTGERPRPLRRSSRFSAEDIERILEALEAEVLMTSLEEENEKAREKEIAERLEMMETALQDNQHWRSELQEKRGALSQRFDELKKRRMRMLRGANNTSSDSQDEKTKDD
ncbi:hypothetical protein CAPTEDRAFT_227939 [Capitella teleta]|uniref:Uncharacterized protein n=1 Tax=Capitella teleta TaxID=283909 RepID=R7TSR8_CAPTE|nr:hypothetical protein CAPTEDRAFT_227939 [Capitella teleta]|eukprot:ELT94070.1 hypothetical protein CAPTEDRAFT_227939 [Capitella teleta]